MKNTKKLTGLKSIHISPETGRISIPAETPFFKQIMISATIMERNDEDVFSYGLEILSMLTNESDESENINRESILEKIHQLDHITLSDLNKTEDSNQNPFSSAGVTRVIRMPEKQLISITLAKASIKRTKIISIQLEVSFEEVMILAADLVHAILNTIEYGEMTQSQIDEAIRLQSNRL